MLIKFAFAFTAFAAMSGAAIAAPVATLSEVAGTVLVDQGRGFVKISTDSAIAAGSRVMLSRDGKGTLVYAGVGGCKRKLSVNTITTVTSSADCHPVAQVAGQAPPVSETAGAGAGAGPAATATVAIATAGTLVAIEAVAQTISILEPAASP